MCVFKQQLMRLITIWIDLCFNFMVDITQLSPDGIIGLKHCQRTLDTKEVSQCNPFSTVIIFVLASDISTEAQTHSRRALFSICKSQWKDFQRRKDALAQHPITLHSLHIFSCHISQRFLHCMSFLLPSSLLEPTLAFPPLCPPVIFFPSQKSAAVIQTHCFWFIKHRQMKTKLVQPG